MFTKDNMLSIKKLAAILFTAVMLVVTLTGCMPVESTGDEAAVAGFGGMSMIIYLVVIILVFYFFMIRPEKKRKKQAEEMRNSISIGDNIITIGGMVGKVVNVSGEHITFETGEDRVRIKITKWGVSSIGKDTEEPEQKAGN